MNSAVSERLRRLLWLVPYLAQNPGIELSKLEQELGIGRAALIAELELLGMVGRPPFSPADFIDVAVEGERVTLHLDQRLSRPPRLTSAEAVALAAAARALDPKPADVLGRALARLEEALPADARREYEALAASLRVASDPGVAPLLEPLAEAAVRRREVVFGYVGAGDATVGLRRLQPWRVFTHRGSWYVLGRDVDRGAERLFRVDRMERLTLTDRTFLTPPVVPTPGEALRPQAREGAAMAPTLRFAATVADRIRERFGAEARLLPDGRVEVVLPGATEAFATGLALSLAGFVEVVGPESLRTQVRAAARRGLSQHRREGAP